LASFSEIALNPTVIAAMVAATGAGFGEWVGPLFWFGSW
jgi:hypothetical protein